MTHLFRKLDKLIINPQNVSHLLYLTVLVFVFALATSFVFSTGVNSVMASEIKPEFEQTKYQVGTLVPVQILLNTQKQKINTVALSVRLPIGVKVEVSDGNSIISHWVEGPTLTGSTIQMSGIVANGFMGQDGLLLTLYVSADQPGIYPISFVTLPKVYLNDGVGTADKVNMVTGAIEFTTEGTIISPTVDTTPPEPFKVIVTRDPGLFNNDFTAVFQTQDKGSGIDHYEIYEGGGSVKEWKRVSSPYRLNDQSRQSFIHVKAVDRAGNERTSIATPSFEVPLLERLLWPFIIIIIILALFTIWRLLNHHVTVKKHIKNRLAH